MIFLPYTHCAINLVYVVILSTVVEADFFVISWEEFVIMTLNVTTLVFKNKWTSQLNIRPGHCPCNDSITLKLFYKIKQTLTKCRASCSSWCQSFFTIATNVIVVKLFIRIFLIFLRLSLNKFSNSIYLHKASGTWRAIDKWLYLQKRFPKSSWFPSEKSYISDSSPS